MVANRRMWKASYSVWNVIFRQVGLLCWDIDGTFRIVGKPSKQLFTIHCLVRKFRQSYNGASYVCDYVIQRGIMLQAGIRISSGTKILQQKQAL